MYLQSLLVSALLASGSLAMDFQEWNKLNKRTIVPVQRRQTPGGSAFVPGSNSGSGATCADAFGAGFVQCGTGNECFDPSAGESCCQATYPCPSGSFCLINGYCCPNGLDVATCAAENGVTLPAGFTTSGAASPSSSAAAAAATGTGAITTTATSNYTVIPTGVPTTSAPITPFTGAASPQNFVGSAAAVAGILGFLGVAL